MKYLTPEQVKKATRGPKSALNVSIKHWKQNMELTEKEANVLSVHDDLVLIDWKKCGLCWWYEEEKDECYDCILRKAGQNCYNNSSLYSKAKTAYTNWLEISAPFSDFTAAAKNMYEFLLILKE